MKTLFCIIFLMESLCSNAQEAVVVSSNATIKPDSLKLNKVFKVAKKILLPMSLVTYGAIAQNSKSLRNLDISTRNTINTNKPGFHTKIDNYLQFVPAVSVYALNAIGVKGKNNFRDRTIIYAVSNIFSFGLVKSLKQSTKVLRPDGTSFNSFPSGHTATAFGNAEFLRQEYKDVSPWYGIMGYAAAVTTGGLRVYNNRHWVSDVVAGAGFGILSTKLAYWIYPSIKKHFFKNKNASALILPFYQNGNTGLVALYQFRN